MLTRLHEERDPGRRARVFGFPRGVAMLAPEIGAFVDAAFGATLYDVAPWLRGVYLTSATQEGAPIDRAQSAVARAFGLPEPAPATAARTAGRSYFLGGLLREVVFREAELVGVDRVAQRRRAWLRGGGLALLAGGVLAVLATWVIGLARDQQAIDRLRERVAAYAATQPAADAGEMSPDDLLQRLDALRSLAHDEAQAPASRIERAIGLPQARHLEQAAQRTYVRELDRLLAPRLAAGLADTLRAAGNDNDAAYAALKGLVMLAQPEHRDAPWLGELARVVWMRWWPDAPAKTARMQAHLDALLAGGLPPVEVDEALVRDARATLNRLPLADLAYARIRREALDGREPPWRLRDALGKAGAAAFERRDGSAVEIAVPAFFTPEGHARLFLAQGLRVTQALRDETWVLGTRRDDLGAGELAALGDEVGRRYAADYVRAWQGLLAGIAPATLRDPTQALSVIAQLTGPNSALRALLVAVARNTALAPATAGLVAGRASAPLAPPELQALLRRTGVPAADATPSTPAADVTRAFADLAAVVQPAKDGPAPIDAVIERLGRLYAELDAATTQPAADPAARVDSPAARGLREIALAQPGPLKDWLLQLADGAVQLGDQQQQAAMRKKRGDDQKALRDKINAAWQGDVLPFCLAAVAGRYPADRHSTLDATPRDFGRLFAPGGLVDAFVRDQLKPYINMSRHPWRWRSADDIDLGARPDSLHALEVAATWRDAFFHDGAPVPSFEFGIRPVAADTGGMHAALALGDQQRIDRAAPARWQTWRWPAPDGVQQATITLGDTPADGRSADGAWSWLRLLDQASLDRVAPDRVVATFRLAAGSAQVELRAASVINPLQPQAAERFECPKGF
jgi:type VI secretion system protein ImpL